METTGGSAEALLRTAYMELRPAMERVRDHVLTLLNDYKFAFDNEHRVHSVKGRIKDFASLLNKATRNKNLGTPEEVFARITDLVGVRIVCNTLDGRRATCRWIEELSKQSNPPIVIQEASPKEYDTGYRSYHFLVQLKSGAWPGVGLPPEASRLVLEIQVRTILEEAWGEVEHRLVYKSHVPRPKNMDEVSDAAKLWRALTDGFVKMSSRLHESDLTLEDLSHRVQQAVKTSEYVFPKTYDIDASKLGLDAAHTELVALQLRFAAKDRSDGNFEKAIVRHDGLHRNPDLAALGAQAKKSIELEIAYDHLLWARHAQQTGENRTFERELKIAEQSYRKLEDEVVGGERVFAPFRLAEVLDLKLEFAEAAKAVSRAAEVLRQEGTPQYSARPLREATLARAMGYYVYKQWTLTGTEGHLSEARTWLERACEQLRAELESERGMPHEHSTLQTEYLLATNGLVYLLLREGQKANRPELVNKATKLIEQFEGSGLVSADIAEQSPNWADTCFGVMLEQATPKSPPKIFVRLETMRRRVLDYLEESLASLDDDDFEQIIGRVKKFETLAAERLRLLRTKPGAPEPRKAGEGNEQAARKEKEDR